MKKFFVIFALFCAIVLVSCSKHTVATISVSKDEKLKTEGMRVWSRPIEIGFQVSGSIEGSADNKGSKPIAVKGSGKTSVNLFSGNKSIEIDRLSPLAKLAAFNAIQTAKADGMVITMLKETNDEGYQTAWVKGIALKLVIYDEVSSERSDAFRYCEISCEKGECQGCIRINSSSELKDVQTYVPTSTTKSNE